MAKNEGTMVPVYQLTPGMVIGSAEVALAVVMGPPEFNPQESMLVKVPLLEHPDDEDRRRFTMRTYVHGNVAQVHVRKRQAAQLAMGEYRALAADLLEREAVALAGNGG